MLASTIAVTGLLLSTLLVDEASARRRPPKPPPPPPSSCQGYYGLTFDDGPVPMSAQYISALKTAGAKATFFVNGYRIAQYPGYIEQMAAAGNYVNNHTENHDDLRYMDATTFNYEIDKTNERLLAAGIDTILLRPPYGGTNADVRAKIEAKGYLQTMWSVDTKDWEADATVSRNVSMALTVQNGGILLMHENKPNTLNAIPQIVSQLKSQKGLCPGKIVKSSTERPTDRPDLTMNVVAVAP